MWYKKVQSKVVDDSQLGGNLGDSTTHVHSCPCTTHIWSQYAEGIVCLPTEGYDKFEIVQFVVYTSWIVFASFSVSILVSICVVLGALCYLKRHTILEGALYKRQ